MSNYKPWYSVIVSNVGTVHCDRSSTTALDIFEDYRELSARSHTGRCAGQDVTLMIDDTIFKQYFGSNSDESY